MAGVVSSGCVTSMKQDSVNTELTIRCPRCLKETTVNLSTDRFVEWQTDRHKGGLLIQQAFPEMPKDKREQLISGYCLKCQETIYSSE